MDLNPDFESELRTVTSKRLVEDASILDRIERIVFLSVPHRGTNIADFTRRFRMAIAALAEQTEVGLRASQIGLFETIDRWFWTYVSTTDRSPQLLAAIRDALFESFPPESTDSPEERYAAALSRGAYNELLSWVEGVKSDFFAIDDLAVHVRDAKRSTPARYDERLREKERAAWASYQILTRSYATVGRCPYDRPPRAAPFRAWELPQLLSALGPDRTANTDWVYRFAYAATAAGSFAPPPGNDTVLDNGARRRVEPWENDGIVNTASMLWPDGEATHLVQGDHGDIIGHYDYEPAVKASETLLKRQGHRYDLLGSDSGFDDAAFHAVWSGVFEFCME
jgi:triacylglycerol lipase